MDVFVRSVVRKVQAAPQTAGGKVFTVSPCSMTWKCNIDPEKRGSFRGATDRRKSPIPRGSGKGAQRRKFR